MNDTRETIEEFPCFGSRCSLHIGDADEESRSESIALAKRCLLAWHSRFSRFQEDSELSHVNADRRDAVPVSPLMGRFAHAVRTAGALTGGLVDATLHDELCDAGYRDELPPTLELRRALALAPARAPARASGAAAWRHVEVDPEAGVLTRPAGVHLDSGGLAKGLFADVLAWRLAAHESFAVDCGGDLALGGTGAAPRTVHVESPFDGSRLHTFELRSGGVATSGIGKRSWLDAEGRPSHHLLDPSTGRPAFTGLVQVTALADSALLAEIRAKAALLSGPGQAAAWLPGGGVIVFDDGSHWVIDPPAAVTPAQLAQFTSQATHSIH